jgi:hypothetical protein
MAYYPKNKIQTNLSTNGNEYQLLPNYNLDNGIYYIGYYYKLYNGEAYTGKFPDDGNNDKLIFVGDKSSKPKPKSITPKSTPPLFPTEGDYKNGSFIRYFFKKRNEYLFKEITKDELNNVDKNLYITFELRWILTGVKETVFNTNRNITLLTEQKNNVYGLSLFLNENYLQYYK